MISALHADMWLVEDTHSDSRKIHVTTHYQSHQHGKELIADRKPYTAISDMSKSYFG